MTALTGETGAGKTLVVEAIELLVGGRADAVLVRPGADRGVGRGPLRQTPDGDEVILARAVPGRAGAAARYVDGRMAPRPALAEWGSRLVDLHGQHAHQSLLSPAVQRAALDTYGRVDRAALDAARARIRDIDGALAAPRRRRTGPGPGDRPAALPGGRARRRRPRRPRRGGGPRDARRRSWPKPKPGAPPAAAAHDALDGDGGAGEALGAAVAALRGRGAERATVRPTTVDRLTAVAAEMADAPRTCGPRRRPSPTIPSGWPRSRPAATCSASCAASTARPSPTSSPTRRGERPAWTSSSRSRSGRPAWSATRWPVAPRSDAAAAAVADRPPDGRARAGRGDRGAPPGAGPAPGPVRGGRSTASRPADDVVFGLGANPGEPVLPLAKVASGGELARTMLAARLVLTAGPPTLVFDEVDAGIGGEAAIAVGRALAGLGERGRPSGPRRDPPGRRWPPFAARPAGGDQATSGAARSPGSASRGRRAGPRAQPDALGPPGQRRRPPPRRRAAGAGRHAAPIAGCGRGARPGAARLPAAQARPRCTPPPAPTENAEPGQRRRQAEQSPAPWRWAGGTGSGGGGSTTHAKPAVRIMARLAPITRAADGDAPAGRA